MKKKKRKFRKKSLKKKSRKKPLKKKNKRILKKRKKNKTRKKRSKNRLKSPRKTRTVILGLLKANEKLKSVFRFNFNLDQSLQNFFQGISNKISEIKEVICTILLLSSTFEAKIMLLVNSKNVINLKFIEFTIKYGK